MVRIGWPHGILDLQAGSWSIARDFTSGSLPHRLFQTCEIVSRVDKRDVRECLGEIANQPLCLWIVFFGQKSDIISEREQPFE